MHSAPPVFVSVGRFVWGVRLAWGLALFTLLILLYWAEQVDAQAQTMGMLLLAWVVVGVLSRLYWRRQCWPAGQLHWDGQVWRFEASDPVRAPKTVALRVVWDRGASMCLHLRLLDVGMSQGGAGYAWLCAQEQPTAWHGLRCALHQSDTL